jgi:hypothetical protein
VDKELLFKPRLHEEEVELPGVGVIRIRALTRDEVVGAREEHTDEDGQIDHAAVDNAILARSLVDPELTEDEVARWAAAAPAGEVTLVTEAVKRVSALDVAAFQPGVQPNRRERRAAGRGKVRTQTRS